MPALFIILGILPSLVWLSIYLKEDEHPEPNRIILRAFLVGALAAPLAAGTELLFLPFFEALGLPPIILSIVIFFGVIAFVEEFWKYFVVRLTLLRNHDFDEPTDAMIYLIVAALGFAAVENVLNLFSFVVSTADAFEIILLRFVSATLLHVLASAVVGYYVARKYFFRRKGQILRGLIAASVIHGIYNLLTLASDGFESIIITIIIVGLLGVTAIVVNYLFWQLKKSFFQ